MKQFAFLTLMSALATSPMAAQTAAGNNPIVTGTKNTYLIYRTFVLKAAEKMPEENYAFQPTPDVRTFGQIIGHVADAQYLFCSNAASQKSPATASVEKTKSSKADLIAALNDAYAYCDKVYAGITDASGAEIVKLLGRDAPRITVLNFNTTHLGEHYGNIVTYMRLKGLVPPSSEAPPPTR